MLQLKYAVYTHSIEFSPIVGIQGVQCVSLYVSRFIAMFFDAIERYYSEDLHRTKKGVQAFLFTDNDLLSFCIFLSLSFSLHVEKALYNHNNLLSIMSTYQLLTDTHLIHT